MSPIRIHLLLPLILNLMSTWMSLIKIRDSNFLIEPLYMTFGNQFVSINAVAQVKFSRHCFTILFLQRQNEKFTQQTILKLARYILRESFSFAKSVQNIP